MRLQACNDAEALALARRLQNSDAETAAEHRRALLLFWYGSGASRLWAEDHPLSPAIRAEHARLAGEVAAIAADAQASAARLRHAGAALGAYVLRQERELRGLRQ
jgi:hypothetical protein